MEGNLQKKIEAAKLASLIIVVTCVVLQWLGLDPDIAGLSDHGDAWSRVTFPFVHANWFHLGVNAYCFLSLVFLRSVTFRQLLVAFLFSAVYPFTSGMPIVGFSGVIFALMGMAICDYPTAKQRWSVFVLVMVVILFGMLLPNVAVGMHLWCFALGIGKGLADFIHNET